MGDVLNESPPKQERANLATWLAMMLVLVLAISFGAALLTRHAPPKVQHVQHYCYVQGAPCDPKTGVPTGPGWEHLP